MHTLKKYFVIYLVVLLSIVVYCDDKFYYFAYGSNLLKKRLLINNPSAVYYSQAKLKNYRLDFDLQVPTWRGAVATIVEDQRTHVWGVLWTLDYSQIKNLDKQEGVNVGWYYAKNVTVTTPHGEEVVARTYELTNNPAKFNGDLPPERRPSSTYLQVIAMGAIESRLPSCYIGFIFSFPTNKKMASKNLRKQLGYPF